MYIDYENIYKALKKYRIHPINHLDFFRVMYSYLNRKEYNILDATAYANFDDTDLRSSSQTYLQSFGLRTKHCSNDGKSSVDMELAVDAVTTIFKNQIIDGVVIIANDRDYIPLIKAIKLENKKALTISTKIEFNPTVQAFSSEHNFIEEIFDFEGKGIVLPSEDEPVEVISFGVDPESITEALTQKAKEMSRLLYNSHFWSKFLSEGAKVGLNGYAQFLTRTVAEPREIIINYFNVAHTLGYLKLDTDEQGMTYFNVGENTSEVAA